MAVKEEADSLEGQITEQELHGAVQSMNNGSSPGMDGLPAEIYKDPTEFPLTARAERPRLTAYCS